MPYVVGSNFRRFDFNIKAHLVSESEKNHQFNITLALNFDSLVDKSRLSLNFLYVKSELIFTTYKPR
jgi:hypothetical protein